MTAKNAMKYYDGLHGYHTANRSITAKMSDYIGENAVQFAVLSTQMDGDNYNAKLITKGLDEVK